MLDDELEEQILAEDGKGTPISRRPITNDIRYYLANSQRPTKPFNPDGRIQARFDMSCMVYLARTNSPFSTVDHPAFEEFVQGIDPRLTVKKRKAIKDRLDLCYENVHREFQKKLATDFPHLDGVCLTVDGWTSRSYEPYLGFTLHYIDKDFVMKKYMLDLQFFEGSHTGQQLANQMDKAVDSLHALGLDPMAQVAIVTDSAANMISATTKSSKCDLPLQCFAHKLHKSIENASKLPCVVEAFDTVRALTTLLHKSTLIYQKLKQACEEVNSKFLF